MPGAAEPIPQHFGFVATGRAVLRNPSAPLDRKYVVVEKRPDGSLVVVTGCVGARLPSSFAETIDAGNAGGVRGGVRGAARRWGEVTDAAVGGSGAPLAGQAVAASGG